MQCSLKRKLVQIFLLKIYQFLFCEKVFSSRWKSWKVGFCMQKIFLRLQENKSQSAKKIYIFWAVLKKSIPSSISFRYQSWPELRFSRVQNFWYPLELKLPLTECVLVRGQHAQHYFDRCVIIGGILFVKENLEFIVSCRKNRCHRIRHNCRVSNEDSLWSFEINKIEFG